MANSLLSSSPCGLSSTRATTANPRTLHSLGGSIMASRPHPESLCLHRQRCHRPPALRRNGFFFAWIASIAEGPGLDSSTPCTRVHIASSATGVVKMDTVRRTPNLAHLRFGPERPNSSGRELRIPPTTSSSAATVRSWRVSAGRGFLSDRLTALRASPSPGLSILGANLRARIYGEAPIAFRFTLLNENTRQACGWPGRWVSVCVPPV